MTLNWIDQAEKIGGYLAAEQGPNQYVTILLGAGGSRSSGGPSTPKVVSALAEDFPGEFPESKVSKGMDSISDSQVENTIQGLFTDVSPHVGYLSLAALAKSTRVLVVNLNWDSAIEMACERVGIKAASLVLDESDPDKLDQGLAAVEAALADDSVRLVNLHLHGRLGESDIRLAPKRTAAFQSKTISLLWRRFFIHPTVVVGATLSGERDVTGLLTAASQEQGSEPKRTPFWLFSKQAERTDRPQDEVAAELLSRNESKLNFRGDPFVDFDRIMVTILAKRRGRPLRDVFAGTHLPSLDENQIVFPAPDLLRDHLERESGGRLLALVGEPKLGKSTTAMLIAHWASLRADDEIKVTHLSGRARVTRTVRSLRNGSLKAREEEILVLDEPFATEQEQSNRELIELLRELLVQPERPRVIVTASPSAWQRAVEECTELEEVAELVAAKPTDWYAGSDLAALADDPSSEHPAMVTRRVLEGSACTPLRVWYANQGRYPSHEEDVIVEKVRLLRGADQATKSFLALVRFCELSRTVVPQTLLDERIGADAVDLPPTLRALLREVDGEEESHLVFAHYTDRVAFDRLYLQEKETLRSELVELAYGRNVVDDVCDVWLTIASLRRGMLERLNEMSKGESSDRGKLVEWGPLLLEEAANAPDSHAQLEGVLKRLLKVDEDRDFWSLRELVYEVVRLWPELHHSPIAVSFLKGTLEDSDRMGSYCVLEAMLYFQGAIHREVWDRDYVVREIWDRVTVARWDLLSDVAKHGAELALMFDAIAWSRPPLGVRELATWANPLLDELEKEEDLRGVLALSCLYHPAGAELLADIGRDSPLDYIDNLNEVQMAKAAETVRWHYIHQSRGRALLTRRRLEPSCPELLRREHLPRLVAPREAKLIERFVRRMGGFPDLRGWAVHLALNLRCTAGKFEDDFLGRLIGLVDQPDDGLITAALTYRIPGGVLSQAQEYFHKPSNRERMLDVMVGGCIVEGLSASTKVQVRPPRFMAGRIPQLVHQELGTRWRAPLNAIETVHEPRFPVEVLTILSEAEEAGFVDPEDKWTLLEPVQHGDLRPLESTRARDPHNRNLKRWLKGRGPLAAAVVPIAADMRVMRIV